MLTETSDSSGGASPSSSMLVIGSRFLWPVSAEAFGDNTGDGGANIMLTSLLADVILTSLRALSISAVVAADGSGSCSFSDCGLTLRVFFFPAPKRERNKCCGSL